MPITDTETLILSRLYKVLETLKYPEIAQTSCEQFADTILRSEKRLDMLVWILEQCSDSPEHVFSEDCKKDVSLLKEKLFQCYSQFGFCNEVSILFGDCPMLTQQIFFKYLTQFIKSVHPALSLDNNADKTLFNKTLNTSHSIESEEKESIAMQTTLSNGNDISINGDHIEEPLQINGSCEDTVDRLYDNLKSSKVKSWDKNEQNYEQIFQDCFSSFKPIAKDTKNLPHSHKELSNIIQNIYFKFSTLLETSINEKSIKDQPCPEVPVNSMQLLSELIEDNLVTTEQACNSLDT